MQKSNKKEAVTVKTWLERAKTQIDALDAELIAMFSFAPEGADRSWLVAHGEDTVIKSRLEEANELLQERRDGIPLAYVLGEKEFYGRGFAVGVGVLIPRPETESLIDLIKGLQLPARAKFLEIGTGSGCIAVTLALEFSQSRVMASDISQDALDIARDNNLFYEGRVVMVESDLFKQLKLNGREHFDVVVANLPYVNKDWDWVDTKNLCYEPSNALYATGSNGLSMYKRFFKELKYRQDQKEIWVDYVVVEADPCQHAELIKVAEKAGWIHLKTDGYGLLFESEWRYVYDWENKQYIHKTSREIELELLEGEVLRILGEDR